MSQDGRTDGGWGGRGREGGREGGITLKFDPMFQQNSCNVREDFKKEARAGQRGSARDRGGEVDEIRGGKVNLQTNKSQGCTLRPSEHVREHKSAWVKAGAVVPCNFPAKCTQPFAP